MAFLVFAETIQLLPDGSLLIHVAMILAMIWILNRTFFGPINKVIVSREKHKGGQNGEAAAILKEAEAKNADYSTQLQEARSEGYSLIEQERSKAVSARNSKIENAKAEIAKSVENQNAELKKQIGDAEKLIAEEAAKMADTISSNILKTG